MASRVLGRAANLLIKTNLNTYSRTNYKLAVAVPANLSGTSTRKLHKTPKYLCAPGNTVKENEASEKHEFQAETRMLLDIVAKSLYSDKEVFLRELVSNASDALEKARYLSVEGKGSVLGEDDLRISITTDKLSKTLSIHDTGVGMTKEEMISHLGTIARSGSKAFMDEVSGKAGSDVSNIIGKFGVGFYSSFMVSDKVEVFTRTRDQDSVGYKWSSDGCGSYTLEECDGVEPGTKVVCHLKVEDREYSDEKLVKDVLKKYSSFIGSVVEVNGEVVNAIQPLWMLEPKEVTSQQHTDFYRFTGASYDTPRFTLHYRTDAPINLRALLYFPEGKPGLFDLSREGSEGGVALYCRKVLIKNNVADIVPKWLRFVKGVVDSEDIPLNLSREMLQNSGIIRKVRTVLENRCIRFLSDKLRKDPEQYQEFFNDYGLFLKEGVITATDQSAKEEIGRLLVFESSGRPAGERVSLGQQAAAAEGSDLYYLAAPTRELALASPYYEALKKRGLDVLFCYENYDEVVLMQLQEINGKKLVSAEKDMRRDKDEVEYVAGGLSASQTTDLMDYLKGVLAGKCFTVKPTTRLQTHPCVVTVEEMASARHFVKTQFSQVPEANRYNLLQPQLEINPSHALIVKLNSLRTAEPQLAAMLAKQLFSNALVTAGLVDDARSLVTDINLLLERALCGQLASAVLEEIPSDAEFPEVETTSSEKSEASTEDKAPKETPSA